MAAGHVPGRGPDPRGRGLQRARSRCSRRARRSARSASSPTTRRCSAMLEPTELRLYRSETRHRALRPGRGLHPGRRQPGARPRRGGASRPSELDVADLRDKLATATAEARARAAEHGHRGAAPRRCATSAAGRRSCGSPRASAARSACKASSRTLGRPIAPYPVSIVVDERALAERLITYDTSRARGARGGGGVREGLARVARHRGARARSHNGLPVLVADVGARATTARRHLPRPPRRRARPPGAVRRRASRATA